MNHPFSVALTAIVLVLAVVLTGVVLVQTNIVSIPESWTASEDDGAGVVDNDDGAADDDETSTSVISESGNVEVTSPDVGEIIGLPLAVTGNARVFESTLNYQLFDADGSVLAAGYVMTNAPDMGEFGDFTITTSYDEPSGTTGTLEVFDYSAKDGSVIDLAEVPIVFPTMATMTVKTYWTTLESGDDCSRVEASEHRIAKTVATAHAALSQLLAGPDSSDVSNGYGTSIPKFTTLKSITIEDGVATAEFSSAIEAGGSCRVTSIRAQIEETLKQFPTVTSVVIRSEGKTAAESLQP
jgi:Immunoglobulin-like domain of bacterial spore germination/Sporulation and spore germination